MLYIFTDWFSKVTGYILGEDEKTKVAHCLEGQDVEFYTNKFCAECERQRDVFGSSIRFVNNVDCGKDKEKCPHIREIPAWYINKTIYYGYKNLTELKDLSDCKDAD
jgi:hypothetical protein